MERFKLTIEEGVSIQEIMGAIFPSHVSVILDKISKCGRDYEYIKCLLDDLYVCWGRYDKSTYLLEYLKYSLGLFEIPVCGFMEVDERRGGIMHINMDTGKAWNEKGESVPASQFENFFEERIMRTRLTTFALSVIKEWVRNKEIQLQATSESQQVPQSVLTDRAKKYFQRAIEAGYMTETTTGYKWNGKTVRWGYFIKCVYDPKNNSPIPQKALEALFDKGRLDSPLRQIGLWKNTPKWVEEMDNTLFYD